MTRTTCDIMVSNLRGCCLATICVAPFKLQLQTQRDSVSEHLFQFFNHLASSISKTPPSRCRSYHVYLQLNVAGMKAESIQLRASIF